MKTEYHPSESRGHASHGWLESYHSFSFASYYNPNRMQFGKLRVLNDDRVAPGQGFGTHPHRNMEIISIPLEGDLEHKDSMGNVSVIRQGDVQVMSAGSGVSHSEYNKNTDAEVRFLQIWILPNTLNAEPRYDQITLQSEQLKNTLSPILGPKGKHDGLWIHQDAWFHMGHFDKGVMVTHRLQDPQHGLYIFLLEGGVNTAGVTMHRRDGLAIREIEEVELNFTSDSEILLMEVPMAS